MRKYWSFNTRYSRMLLAFASNQRTRSDFQHF